VGRVNFTLFKGMVCRTRLLAVSIMLTLAASGLSGLRLRTKALSPSKVYRSLVNYPN
jgi:hypothetical protein